MCGPPPVCPFTPCPCTFFDDVLLQPEAQPWPRAHHSQCSCSSDHRAVDVDTGIQEPVVASAFSPLSTPPTPTKMPCSVLQTLPAASEDM